MEQSPRLNGCLVTYTISSGEIVVICKLHAAYMTRCEILGMMLGQILKLIIHYSLKMVQILLFLVSGDLREGFNKKKH